jgi:hypothetical protein
MDEKFEFLLGGSSSSSVILFRMMLISLSANPRRTVRKTGNLDLRARMMKRLASLAASVACSIKPFVPS